VLWDNWSGQCHCVSHLFSEQLSLDISGANESNSSTQKENNINIVFSDIMRKDLGLLLSKNLGENVINYCDSGSNCQNILEKLCKFKFRGNENLILIFGNRGNVNKLSLRKYCEHMISLNVKQIVIFTFPYCNSLSQVENYHRYKLNLTLHTISNYNDKIHVFDINKLNNLKFYNSIVRLLIMWTKMTFGGLPLYHKVKIVLFLSELVNIVSHLN
jgi:hypothetical protein